VIDVDQKNNGLDEKLYHAVHYLYMAGGIVAGLVIVGVLRPTLFLLISITVNYLYAEILRHSLKKPPETS